MEIHKHKACILSQLKKRNFKEHSFQELIQYSNKLLESVDYLQKEALLRKFQTAEQISNGPSNTESIKSEESALSTKCRNLQEELKQCHVKISEYAQQILDLKNVVEEKTNLIVRHTNDLEKLQKELSSTKDRNELYQKQLSNMKSILQDKSDEFDALNITFSSVENKKNDLEIEVKKLKNEILMLKSLERSSASSDSSKSASITSALLSAANDISVGQAAKTEVIEKREPLPKPASPAKITLKQSSNSSVPTNVVHDFIAHDSEINAVLWMNYMESDYLVSAGSDRKVKVWKINDENVELYQNIRGCNSSILSVDIDPNANLLLCASSDFASRVWTVCDFTIRHTLTGHSGKVTSSKFMDETNRIVSGSSDQTLKFWDLRQRVCIGTYNTNSPINDVVCVPNSFVISGHSDKKIFFWDPREGNLVNQIMCTKAPTSLDLSKTGYSLLVSERSNLLKIYDTRMTKEANCYQADGFEVGCEYTRAKFSPDGKYCCCGSKNGSIFIWNVLSKTVEMQLKGHKSNVTSCGWNTSGSLFASCDKNRHCIIWN